MNRRYSILADLFLYTPSFLHTHVGQLLVTLPFTSQALVDLMGREDEHGYNAWATAQLLKQGGFRTQGSYARSLYANAQGGGGDIDKLGHGQGYQHGSAKAMSLSPLMMKEVLVRELNVHPDRHHFFQHSFRTLGSATYTNTDTDTDKRIHNIRSLTLPSFCRPPPIDSEQHSKLLQWVRKEMNARCHPNRMWLECVHDRTYEDPFLPCPQQLGKSKP